MLVPTVDTIRNAFVTRTLVMNKCHTLLVGDTGTGKTVLAQVLYRIPTFTPASFCSVALCTLANLFACNSCFSHRRR